MITSVVNFIILIVAHLVLFLIECVYFSYLLVPKTKYVYAGFGYVLLNVFLSVLGVVLTEKRVLLAVIYYTSRTLYVWFISKDRRTKKAWIIIMMNVLFFFTEMLEMSLMSLFTYRTEEMRWAAEYSVFLGLYAAFLSVFAYYFKNLTVNNIGKKSLLFVMLPVSQLFFCIAYLIFDNYNDTFASSVVKFNFNNPALFALYFIAAILVSFAVDIAIFKGFIENVRLHDARLKLKALEYQNNANLRYYTDVKENTDKMKAIRRDLLGILQTIHGLNENSTGEDREKADRIYSELVERIKSIRFEDYCDNNLVNAILASKIGECRGDDVKLEIKAAVGENISLNDFDLCRVLVNMLDNAIEACRKIENHAERKITFEMFKKEDYLYIITSNPVPDKEISDFSVTSKPNKKEHGMGIEILNEIAKINNGDFSINIEEKIVDAVFSAQKKL